MTHDDDDENVLIEVDLWPWYGNLTAFICIVLAAALLNYSGIMKSKRSGSLVTMFFQPDKDKSVTCPIGRFYYDSMFHRWTCM